MSMIDVKPSAVRKYLYEYVLIALSSCVIFLFLSMNALNTFIRTELTLQRNEMIKAVEQNTNSINNFLNYQKNKINETNYRTTPGYNNFNRNNFEIIPYDKKLFPLTQRFESLVISKQRIEQ